ncbi:electron transport complex subunit RsxC [Candidatus Acetothermia bacterium]|nr:electron transport complex subunit RsxC [Candidatus Acetothermia bacterium]
MKRQICNLLRIKDTAGVHPPQHKLTAGTVIESAPLPDRVTLLMKQHSGAPAKLLVKQGDIVQTGQLIAEATTFISAPVHATLSGEVKQISSVVHPLTGELTTAVTIVSDGADNWVETVVVDPNGLSREEIIARVQRAGVVGLGGGGFPTHVKLQPPADKPIHTVIANGAECEPYITADTRLMIEDPERVVSGLQIVMRVLKAKEAYIAIEENKPEAIARLRTYLTQLDLPHVHIFILKACYPMGEAAVLIREVLGIEVPAGKRSRDVGVLVQNVGTLAAIYDSVACGKPLVEQVMTITGMVTNPKNLRVRFGTAASHLITLCGGVKPGGDKLLFGGPMLGIAQLSYDSPVVKAVNCILVIQSIKREERNCVRCARCIEVCPMELMPLMYYNYVRNKSYDRLAEYWIETCMECGACAYACPANIPLVSYIHIGKDELEKQKSDD